MRLGAMEMLVTGAIMLFLSSGCGAPEASGPFRGRVVEAGTGKPLQDAITVVVWYYESSLVHARTTAFDARESVTDNEGRWELPALSRGDAFFRLGITYQIRTFMPGGYEVEAVRTVQAGRPATAEIITSMRQLATREERCEALLRPTAFAFEPREKMPRLIAAVDRERTVLKCGSPR